jgi:hypothetical protein
LRGSLFWLRYPFAITAYTWRRRKLWREVVPRLWLSQGKLLSLDLEMFEDQDPKIIDRKFIDDFAKARDETLATIKKQIIISALIFLFLLSNYLSLGLDISIAGFSLRYTPGIPEGLLLISNLLSCYTLVLQGNCYLLDAAIKFAIKKAIPEELRTTFLIRYFPHENIGGFQTFNLPHITPTKITSKITSWTLKLFLILLCITVLAYTACYFFLLIHHLWIKPNFGIWSHILLAYLLLCGLGAFLYSVLTRFPLPYDDYTTNNEIELLQQINPQAHRIRLRELYSKLNDARREMERLGYWPAPGFEDTEFGVLMEPEVDHGEAEVYARVQA